MGQRGLDFLLAAHDLFHERNAKSASGNDSGGGQLNDRVYDQSEDGEDSGDYDCAERTRSGRPDRSLDQRGEWDSSQSIVHNSPHPVLTTPYHIVNRPNMYQKECI